MQRNKIGWLAGAAALALSSPAFAQYGIGAYVPSSVGGYKCSQTTNGGSPTGCAATGGTDTSTPVTLTTNTVVNVASVSLTPGNWVVCGLDAYFPAAGTTNSLLVGSISTTSATEAAGLGGGAYTVEQWTFATGALEQFAVGCTQMAPTSTTTVYLTERAGFATSTATAGGFLWAVRLPG